MQAFGRRRTIENFKTVICLRANSNVPPMCMATRMLLQISEKALARSFLTIRILVLGKV